MENEKITKLCLIGQMSRQMSDKQPPETIINYKEM